MTPDEAVHAMAARLAAVDWARGGDKAWSRAALLKEYLRRAARWATAYGCDTRTPFYDVAACVDPTVRAAQHTVDQLLDVMTAARAGWNAKQVAPFILHWTALRATRGVALPPGLEDPFEPLLLLFERGGAFHTENGEVNLEWKSVRLSGWRARADDPPPADLSTEALDEIDRTGSVTQFGHVIEPLD